MRKQLKIIITCLTVVICLFTVTTIVAAEESTETQVKKYNVTFPVAELGNCKSFSECRAYCDDETHLDACISFAKKKGFYKEESKIGTKRQSMMQAAKNELGCNSELTCEAVCQKEENFNKCRSFAEKNGLADKARGPGPGDRKIIEKAKSILGCNSESSCRAICEQDSNRDKCSEFAKQTGLEGGIKRVGPGGCNSEESCRAYCEKNMDECRKFGGGSQRGEPPEESKRRGPGGCNSEESCRQYCEKNPDECRKFGGDKSSGRQMKGPGGCDSEESCRKYCTENPQECGIKKPPEGSSTSPEEFCKNNPEKCKEYKSQEEYEQKPQGESRREDRQERQEQFDSTGSKPPEEIRRREIQNVETRPEGEQRYETRPQERRLLEERREQPREDRRPPENMRREENRSQERPEGPAEERRTEERKTERTDNARPEVQGASTVSSLLLQTVLNFLLKE